MWLLRSLLSLMQYRSIAAVATHTYKNINTEVFPYRLTYTLQRSQESIIGTSSIDILLHRNWQM